MTESPQDGKDGMFSVRTAVVMVASVLVAVAAAGLQYLAEPSVPKAMLTGGIAFGLAFWWWHRAIEQRKGD